MSTPGTAVVYGHHGEAPVLTRLPAPPGSPPLVAIYIRISSNDVKRARAESRGMSPEEYQRRLDAKAHAHTERARKYARRQGWEIAAEFVDSGIGASRLTDKPLPQREALFAWISAHPGCHLVVLSTEVRRLIRQKKHAQRIQEFTQVCTLDIWTTSGTSYLLNKKEGEKAFADEAAAAEDESLTISERRRAKEAERAEDGDYWGIREPFGGELIFDEDPVTGEKYSTGRLRQVPGEVRVLRESARRIIDGNGTGAGSMRQITLYWREQGITSKKTGKPLTQSQIGKILKNKRLAGTRVHRAGDNWGRAPRNGAGDESQGIWENDEPVFDEETYDDLLDILGDPARRTSASNTQAHMLTGEVLRGRCSTCGADAKAHYDNGHADRHGNRKRYRSYICPAPPAGRYCFRQNADAVDRFVMLTCLRWTAPDGPYQQYLAGTARPVTDYAPALAALDEREGKLRRKQKSIAALLADEDREDDEETSATMAAQEVRGKLRELRGERKRLRAAEKAEKAGQDEAPRTVRVPTPAEWEGWDGPAKAEWCARFVAGVRIDPPGQGQRFFNPETVHVIPGPWADGISPAVLGACTRDVTDEHYPGLRLGRTRQAVTAWLADHPWATAKEAAESAGINLSFAYQVLDAAEAAGEVIRHRPGRGRGGGATSMRFALAGTAAEVPGSEPDPRLARTRAAITAFLAGHPWSGGDEVAAAAGLRSPSRARQVMNAMAATGIVITRIPPHDGRPGRMPSQYALADQAAGGAASA